MHFDLVGWNPQGSRQFAGGFLPVLFVSGVDQNDVFSIVETMLQVYGSDPRGFHLDSFPTKPIEVYWQMSQPFPAIKVPGDQLLIKTIATFCATGPAPSGAT
jgi:hypothetical protein